MTKRTGREDRQMPGPGELPAQHPAPIIGREAGLARLRAHLQVAGIPLYPVSAVTGEGLPLLLEAIWKTLESKTS